MTFEIGGACTQKLQLSKQTLSFEILCSQVNVSIFSLCMLGVSQANDHSKSFAQHVCPIPVPRRSKCYLKIMHIG